MSHYSVLVVTDRHPTQAVLQKTLLPWHEYECTGLRAYCQWVDETDKATETWRSSTTRVYVDEEGNRIDAYDDRFYRDPTPEETRQIGPFAGTGGGNGMFWRSKDWGDGHGYRAKVHFKPEAFLDTQVPVCEVEKSFKRWASEYGNWKPIPGKPGRYGKFTNPNARWDWWEIGGRYSGKLVSKECPSETVNVCRRDLLDLEGMKTRAQDKRRLWIEKCCETAGRPFEDLDVACRLSPIVHTAWLDLPEPRPRGPEYHQWVESKGGEWPILAAFSRACFDLPAPSPNQGLRDWIDSAPPVTSWAVVLDNQWFEKGKMGWWAMSSGDKADWDDHFNDLFGLIREDQWISIVDCHI